MAERSDDELWAAVVAARDELHRAEGDFYQHARSRRDVLARALGTSGRDQGAALQFLGGLSEDVPELLELLVELTTSHRWAGYARRAIGAGHPRELVVERISRIIDERLDGPHAYDDDYFRRFAELYSHLGERELLAGLLSRAAVSPEPETRELVEDFGDELTAVEIPEPPQPPV
jgi:hypothetical protein